VGMIAWPISVWKSKWCGWIPHDSLMAIGYSNPPRVWQSISRRCRKKCSGNGTSRLFEKVMEWIYAFRNYAPHWVRIDLHRKTLHGQELEFTFDVMFWNPTL
jgi:hypothetical protein